MVAGAAFASLHFNAQSQTHYCQTTHTLFWGNLLLTKSQKKMYQVKFFLTLCNIHCHSQPEPFINYILGLVEDPEQRSPWQELGNNAQIWRVNSGTHEQEYIWMSKPHHHSHLCLKLLLYTSYKLKCIRISQDTKKPWSDNHCNDYEDENINTSKSF